jgi:release factor glutamine methyltransferase
MPSMFPAQARQAERLLERRQAMPQTTHVGSVEFVVFPGVYHTSVDTELMSASVAMRPSEDVLELGCGCGAVTVLLSRHCRSAVGVDINPVAVENARHNAARLGVDNATFALSDVFDHVEGTFDVLVCNPPYNQHEAADPVERMFWDPRDEMKRRFFEGARQHLRPKGRVYFGWADFAELDSALPLRLAASAGLRYVKHYSVPSRNGAQTFYVIHFAPV